MIYEDTSHQGQTRPVLWLKDLAERWSVSEVTLWRWRRKGTIPQPTIQIGRRAGWSVNVIEGFEQGRLESNVRTPNAEQPTRKRGAERQSAAPEATTSLA